MSGSAAICSSILKTAPLKAQLQVSQLAREALPREALSRGCSSPNSHAGQTRRPGLELVVVRDETSVRFIMSCRVKNRSPFTPFLALFVRALQHNVLYNTKVSRQ